MAAPGFANKTVTFSLLIEETLNVPVQLAVGSVSKQIVVTARAPTLNTADSRTEVTLESQAVANLLLQGRNLLALTTVAPGVTGLGLAPGGSPGSAADNFSTETQVDASANGRGSAGNMFVVDRLDITSDIRPGVLNLTPNPDTIQETTIQANTFSVEYGRASSIQMVMTSKSGTDRFHGSVSDYYNYQKLWAGTEFLDKYNPFHSSNYSATLGGPIIPHHAFTSWAQQNFPNTIGSQILQKYTPSGATITGVAKTAADIFPGTCGTAATPNLPCSTPMIDTGVFNSSSFRNALQWNTRIDKYFAKDRLYGNFYRTTLDTGGPAVRPAFTTSSNYVTNSLPVNEAHNLLLLRSTKLLLAI